MTIKLNDWTLVFGADTSKVDKAFDKIEKRYGRLMKSSVRMERQVTQAKGQSLSVEKKKSALMSAQNSFLRKMMAAERAGLDITKQWNALNKGSLQTLKQRGLELDRETLKQKRLNDKVKERVRLQRQISTQSSTEYAPSRGGLRASRGRVGTGLETATVALGVASTLPVDPVAENNVNRLTAAIARLNTIQTTLKTGTFSSRKAYEDLQDELHDTLSSVKSLSKETAQLNNRMTAGKFAANGFSQSLKNMARSYISVFAAVSGASAALRVAKDFDRIRAVLRLSATSAQEADENFQFIKQTANELGTDITATADAFAGFNVAAVSAGVTADDSKMIFTQLSESVRATGLDARSSGLAFLAFKQMLAGPVIQAQEMNQVVEQMPQFTGIARKALKELGHEGENFREIIATGTVDSQRFVRVVARMLSKQAKDTGALAEQKESLAAAQDAMTNSFKYMADAIAQSGLKEILKTVFSAISNITSAVTPFVSVVVKGLSLLVFGVKAALGPINDLLSALGFQNGLGDILVGLAAFFAGAKFISMLSGISKLITMLRGLAVTGMIVNAIVNPVRSVAVLAGAGAVAYGTNALFNQVVPQSSQSRQSSGGVSNDNRQIIQNFETNSNADPMEIARLAGQAATQSWSN